MKLSLNWLKEFVQLPASVTPAQIMHDLTMSTVEVERIEDLAQSLELICLGQIRSITKHPNADKLSLCTVDLGQHGIREIVCGGSNLKLEQLVAVALPGAKVHWHGAAELAEVKETKIRGQSSWGMICASEEIGLKLLFPATAAHEIIDLAGFEPELGRPLADLLDLRDFILEIDNKSLSNRPDLWGHFGIARELSAIYDCELRAPTLDTIPGPTSSGELSVSIEDPALCSRYIGVAYRGVKNGPSPFWLRSRLARIGQRPISLLVDLTNYVMLSVGHPTHVFDASSVTKRAIIVRPAKESESITLLGGESHSLRAGTPVIADTKAPIALAGIMGGLDSSVKAESTEIIFEAAHFNAVQIRRAVGHYGLRTDGSMRHEKSLDPYQVQTAAQLFYTLLRSMQPQLEVTALCDIFTVKPADKMLTMEQSFLASRLGSQVDPKIVIKKLSALGFSVTLSGTTFSITIPSYRATGDVSIQQDIVEEVARMLGYDNLQSAPIPVHLTAAVTQPWYLIEKRSREYLVSGARLTEVLTYPWIADEMLAACGTDPASLLSLMESPGPNCSRLRASLIPNILEAVAKNCHRLEHFGIFEIGSVFASETAPFSANSANEKLPRQHKRLCLAIVGSDTQSLFLEGKGVLEGLCRTLGFTLQFQAPPNEPAPGRHPPCDAALDVVINSTVVGTIMIPAIRVLTAAGIRRARVVVTDINFSVLRTFNPVPKPFKPLPRFPTVDFDIAMIFDDTTSWQSIEKLVQASDPLIDGVIFISQYRGDQIPNGKKSIALRMNIVPQERTLTSDEINTIAKKVIKRLESELGGQLR